MPFLGVNIDHVATVRQARRTDEPDPVWAAALCQLAGCDSIVAHLREDRRHINDRDISQLKESVSCKFNLEMSVASSIVNIAVKVKPDQATLVPEKREELTTEGGLDVVGRFRKVSSVVSKLKDGGIVVNLFIDPKPDQIKMSNKTGAAAVELHTGRYAEAKTTAQRKKRLQEIVEAVHIAEDLGLEVNAGHGLTYRNVQPVAAIQGLNELNIGHSIISRAVLVGIERAVREMKMLISRGCLPE